ncbi:MAG: uroporphyrinogen-III C-methyltransferase [Actinobacteria bacterium]|nr:uroporphyrinogen-III C-methyltransferase [Actinomycetota bacterium]
MSALVYLIGAGPGDPELLTLKGRTVLENADVVIYDYLANPVLLDYASADAELIFVGKKGFSEHVTQDQINACIIEKAQQQGVYIVARLKGGDPFVFGRGGEEALALVEEGIEFEVVPGVTSGVAAPAYAGIPVTHRGIASSVTFITGNEDPTKPETAINWEHLAQGADTLCFYMGIKNLPLITQRLIECGKKPETPVALIRWGSLPKQEVLVGTLEDIAQRAEEVGFQAPAITLVGEVAGLREQLAWFENKPLFGRRIAVTRSRTQASDLVATLNGLGADVIEFPTIEIVPMESYVALDDSLARLTGYTWIIFTSVNGVEYFFDRLFTTGKDARALAGTRIAAIGPATAARLCEMGIVPELVPDEYRAEAVLEALLDSGIGAEDAVLIPRALVAREVLPDELRKAGVRVDVAPAYQTVAVSDARVASTVASFLNEEIEAITFTSSSTVTNFESIMKRALEESKSEKTFSEIMTNVDIFSIGPITSKTARDAGLKIHAEAREYTIDGLVEVIAETYATS